MSDQNSLKTAMRETLDANGTVTHIKAELRAAIFKSLAGTLSSKHEETDRELGEEIKKNALHATEPSENMLINELIKEYLAFNGLEHTLSTFQLEANLRSSQVPRSVLAAELNLAGAPSSLPLLYATLHETSVSKEYANYKEHNYINLDENIDLRVFQNKNEKKVFEFLLEELMEKHNLK